MFLPAQALFLSALDVTQSTNLLIHGLVLAAVVFVPFFLGSALAKSVRMPTHATRFGMVLFAITASLYLLRPVKDKDGVWQQPLKYGVDLKGGTILVYELEKDESVATTTPADPNAPPQQAVDSRASELIGALTERLNPSGTNEIVIRPTARIRSRSSFRTRKRAKSTSSRTRSKRQVFCGLRLWPPSVSTAL